MADNLSYFLPTLQIQKLLARYPPHLVEIVLELRDMVQAIAPDAVERVLRKGLGYHRAERGGPVKAGVCQIEIHRDHVRLAFIHGAFLSDPIGLLQGERLYKKYAQIKQYEDAPWEALADLIRASASFDPGSLCL
jgi:hypothetical protein